MSLKTIKGTKKNMGHWAMERDMTKTCEDIMKRDEGRQSSRDDKVRRRNKKDG
jgi:hypothetical protein